MKLSTRSGATVILLLVLSASTLCVAGEDQKWQLEIGLSKTTYLLRESIWLDAVATNVSSDTIRSRGMFPPCLGPLHVEVTDNMGKVLPYTGPIYDGVWGDGFLVKPNEQYYGCFDLLDLFAFSRISTSLGIIPTGKYSVRALFGGAVSQEIAFEVVEPTMQEAEAYQMLIKACENLRASLFREGVDQSPKSLYAEFRDVVERYPKSVYAETAFRRLRPWDEFLKRLPNSGHAEMILRNSTEQLTREEKRKYLTEVVSAYPETRAARFARQMLWMQENLAGEDTTKQGMRE